jgi:hypothetical protein
VAGITRFLLPAYFDFGPPIGYATPVRVLSLARVLFAVLAFQLVLGLQVGVAYAAAMSDASPVVGHAKVLATTTAGDDACPVHNASSHSSPHAKVPLDKSTDKHDCCKSSGCQCQCGNVPLAFNVSVTRSVSASTNVQPVHATRSPVAPADAHFRPPIAAS